MASGIVVVKQFERLVVLRWGQLERVAGPGFRFLVPIIYNGRTVDLREQVDRVPTQKYITRDNVVIDMDFVLYYRVLPEQAEKSVLEVVDHKVAVRSQAVADLRSIVGNIELSEALAERERIQHQLQAALEENTGRWGVKVQGVAINEIDPPPDVKRAMDQEKSAAAIKTAQITESEGIRQSEINKAEGEKQSAILQAEGRRQAQILDAEGKRQAQILEAEGYSIGLERIYEVANTVDNRTMSLEYFDTLKEIGKSPATKFIFPMEFTSMLQPFLGGNRQANDDNGDRC